MKYLPQWEKREGEEKPAGAHPRWPGKKCRTEKGIDTDRGTERKAEKRPSKAVLTLD